MTSVSSNRPPRLPAWILRRTLPPDQHEAILGDLEETFHERLHVCGRTRTSLWFWKECFAASLLFGFERLKDGPASAPPRSRATERWISILWLEFRLGLRSLLKSPLQSVMAVAALGLGVGLATSTFTIVHGSLMRGLPLERSDELVHLSRRSNTELHDLAVVPHDYLAWKKDQSSFDQLGAYVEAIVHLSADDGTMERYSGLSLDATGIALLRAKPAIGRLYDARDDTPGAPPVVLLSHNLWQNRFGGESSIVGRSVRLSNVPTTIIGVMGPDFSFPVAEQFWMPLRLDRSQYSVGEGRLDVVGRLLPGVSIDQARADIEAISSRLEHDYPETHDGIRPQLRTFTEEYVGGRFSRLAYTMLTGALLVLLVAGVNVAGLFLAQSHARSRELKLRVLLGASRCRVISQFLIESGIVAAFGGLLGLSIARLAVSWFERVWVQLGDAGLPHGPELVSWWRFELDAVPLAFAIGLTMFVSLASGLVPAVLASRVGPGAALSSGERVSGVGIARAGRRLVLVQVALTTTLLVATGLSVRSVSNTVNIDWGIRPGALLTARVALPSGTGSEGGYRDPPSRRRFWRRLHEQLLGKPAVEAAALMSTLPLQRAIPTPFRIRGRTSLNETDPLARHATVSAGTFHALGSSVRAGRDLGNALRGNSVVLINESFRRKYFPSEDPLGQQVRLGRDSDAPLRSIIGIVPDLWMDGPRNEQPEGLYVPIEQSTRVQTMSIVVRGSEGVDLGSVVSAVRSAVGELDETLPVYQVQTMHERITQATGRYEIYGAFYTAFGAIALVLAALGLYGLSSFLVERRRREIGLRMALGATRSRVMLGVLGQAAYPLAAGAVIGACLAATATSRMKAALFEVDPLDPLVYIAIALVLVLTGLLASLAPVRRATSIEPLSALRDE